MNPAEGSARAFARRVLLRAHESGLLSRPVEGVLAAVGAVADQALDERRPRTIYQLRAPRPFPLTSDIAYRPLRDEGDIERISDLSRTVFGWHPDVSDYSPEALRAKADRAGFDPSLVLLHELGDRLAGFCWSEIRGADRVALVDQVAVSPDFPGRGIGRQLVIAAFRLLEGRTTKPSRIYVDAGNIKAARLYLDLGCVIWRVEHDWKTPYIPVTEPLRP